MRTLLSLLFVLTATSCSQRFYPAADQDAIRTVWNASIDAATRGSADVAGLRAVTGELKQGLRADFLVLDRRQPEVNPSWDFEWELVRLYNRDQIDAVVVDGKVVMENSLPVGWDAAEFLETNKERARAAVSAAPIVRRHGRSADVRNTS